MLGNRVQPDGRTYSLLQLGNQFDYSPRQKISIPGIFKRLFNFTLQVLFKHNFINSAFLLSSYVSWLFDAHKPWQDHVGD